MTLRTTTTTVFFAKSFSIAGLDEVLPPGHYDVETDEELLEGITFEAYRRVLTLLHVPPKAGSPGLSRSLKIDPDALEVALTRDAATIAVEPERPLPETTAPVSRQTGEVRTERRALDRAENEGMTAQPGQNTVNPDR